MKFASTKQLFPINNLFGNVELKDFGSRLANVSFRVNHPIGRFKMFFPNIFSWVEKPNQLLVAQKRPEVGAFVKIAKRAGQGQVSLGGFAAMFSAQNVFDVKFDEASSLRDSAVFAAIVGPFNHELPQRFWNRAVHAANASG